MKLLFHTPGHHKITQSIQQMCAAVGWICEFTTNDTRLATADYDIVIMNTKYLPPETFPERAKIIYGPQHWVFPQGALVGPLNERYCGKVCYNSLSPWVRELYYEMAGSLCSPLQCFPFSIEIDRFCPAPGTPKTLDCIVYIKRRSSHIVNTVIGHLRSCGLTPAIYRYGSYDEARYLTDLRRTRFMVVLDAHESQGFALEEAMSCNVPLFVVDATSMYDEVDGRDRSNYAAYRPKLLRATSVPYWSDKCGVRITDLTDLSAAFTDFRGRVDAGEFQPREYVLEALSPVVCMQRILDYFHLPAA